LVLNKCVNGLYGEIKQVPLALELNELMDKPLTPSPKVPKPEPFIPEPKVKMKG
jgi:hypothetical protein